MADTAASLLVPTPIAVVGAGMIGRKHLAALGVARGVRAAAVIDPAPAARALAVDLGLPWFPALEDLPPGLARGVILALPNALHVSGGLAALAMGLPVLVEKPLAVDVAGAGTLVAAAEAAGLALMTGHHRRHNPMIAAARALIAGGAIGVPVSVQGTFWAEKPAEYFATDWRRQEGAGPVLLNVIHDIDVMRHLVGEIAAVQAVETRRHRGNAVEDAAVILLEFANGALGTLNVADCIPAPWSWELTAGENRDYAASGQSCYVIGGTAGALELPQLRLWRHDGARGWWDPITATTHPHPHGDPLVLQAAHFGRVIRGEEPPLVSGREGLRTLAAAMAIKTAAARGTRITLDP
ncbi:MAG: Gfo/Idh/MocA family protein [Gemmobacter sp.]